MKTAGLNPKPASRGNFEHGALKPYSHDIRNIRKSRHKMFMVN